MSESRIVLVCDAPGEDHGDLERLLGEVVQLSGGSAVLVAPAEVAELPAAARLQRLGPDTATTALQAMIVSARLLLVSDARAWEDLTFRVPLAAVAVPAVLLEAEAARAFSGHTRRPGEPLAEAAVSAEARFARLTDADRIAVLAELLTQVTEVVTAQRQSIVALSDLVRDQATALQDAQSCRDLTISTLHAQSARSARRLDRLAARLARVRDRHDRRIRRLERRVDRTRRVRKAAARAFDGLRSRTRRG